MDTSKNLSGSDETKKQWEKPAIEDVSITSDEDVLGLCWSASSPTQADTCTKATCQL